MKKKEIKIPKWYKLRVRGKLKKELIGELVREYAKPVKLTAKQEFRPTELDIKDYTEELYKLSLTQLSQIGHIEEANPKLALSDKIAKLKKRKALLITIYHKNGSRTHYVCAKHTRVVKINEHLYLCPPNMGNFDNKYNMMSYSYYENNPFPIQFSDDFNAKDMRGVTIPDGELLKSTNDFEFAQRLAQSRLKDKINLAVVFSVLAFLTSAVTVILCVQGFNLI